MNANIISENVLVENLKCAGCEHTIKHTLLKMKGVQNVIVNEESGIITIEHDDQSGRVDFTKKLHDIGYPEATDENGLLTQIKSYASCLVGRINK